MQDAFAGKMGFGLFLPPMHYVPQNPTRAIHRDLELIEYAESLGFDEAWVGEHHSGGYELIGPNDVFLSAAVQRTEPDPARHRASPRCPTTTRSTSPSARSCSTTSRWAGRSSASAPARCRPTPRCWASSGKTRAAGWSNRSRRSITCSPPKSR